MVEHGIVGRLSVIFRYGDFFAKMSKIPKENDDFSDFNEKLPNFSIRQKSSKIL